MAFEIKGFDKSSNFDFKKKFKKFENKPKEPSIEQTDWQYEERSLANGNPAAIALIREVNSSAGALKFRQMLSKCDEIWSNVD